MTESEVRAYIIEHRNIQPGTKILWGHPSPRFWSPQSVDWGQISALRRAERKLVLYLHIPFCPKTDPPACGFCLFSREDYSGNKAVIQYLDALRREIEACARALPGQTLDCLYFGGGTPNVLRPDDYGPLMDWVREAFPLSDGAEITLEGVPQLFDDERLAAIAEAGVTRVSIGAQVLSPRLLRYSGRNHTALQVLDAIDNAHKRGLAVNVDLICGWFEQTPEDVESDVAALTPHAPESIILHLLTLTGPSPFFHDRARLPAVSMVKAAYERARRKLESSGYWASSYTDFMLKDPPRGPREVTYLRSYREILENDRMGLGCAANSLFTGTPDRPGMTWRNVDSSTHYQERVARQAPAAAEAFAFSPLDLRLLYVMKGLEGTPYLDAVEYERIFGRDLTDDFRSHWTVFEELGWLDISEKRHFRLRGEGPFYTALIQRCLSNDRSDDLRRGAERSRAASA